jgi:hypothetical protein
MRPILTVIIGILLLFSPGCFPPDWEPSTHKEIRDPPYLTDQEIISLVRKGIMDWAEARAIFMRKGYTWWEAEMKLKAHIPERDWII